MAIFGPENYAYRLGLIGAPSRICQALAPLGFGMLIEPLGLGVVAVSALLSLAALVALMLFPAKANAEAAAETARSTGLTQVSASIYPDLWNKKAQSSLWAHWRRLPAWKPFGFW